MSFRNYTLKDREWIKERYKQSEIWDDPYTVLPWCVEYMSPIEKIVRCDLKSRWFKMYPQYPVWNYFLDFADPVKRIWIEVDWKEFHKDKSKDNNRQQYIEGKWWKILRIEWYCVFDELDYDEFADEEFNYDEPLESEWQNKYRNFFMNLIDIYEGRTN